MDPNANGDTLANLTVADLHVVNCEWNVDRSLRTAYHWANVGSDLKLVCADTDLFPHITSTADGKKQLQWYRLCLLGITSTSRDVPHT